MEWLPPALLAAFSNALILGLAYWYMFSIDRKDYLNNWAFAWLLYSFRFICQLLTFFWQTSSVLLIVQQTVSLFSGLLLIWGTYQFIGKKMPGVWPIGVILCDAWTIVTQLTHQSFMAINLPVDLFLGAIYIFTGIIHLRLKTHFGYGSRITGWAFIIWGIHKADYSFLRPYAWFAPWGFLAASLLFLIVAIGLILVYYEKTREEQRQSESRFRLLAENSTDMISRHNPEGIYLYVSPACQRLFGYEPEELLGRSAFDFVHPEDKDSINKTLKTILSQPITTTSTFRFLQKDGSYTWCETTSHAIINSMTGETTEIHASTRDITARKRVEEEIYAINTELENRVEERTSQLAIANRELEAFSYSVSHDLKAPLRSINGFSKIMEEDYGPQLDSTALGYLNLIRSSSDQMEQLINDLLELSHVNLKEMTLSEVNLSDICRELLEDLRTSQPARQVEIDIEENLVAKVDKNLIRIVLDNLLRNAWKFTGKKMNAKIEVRGMKRDGKSVYLVRDNGVGFDMAFADKVFNPFQRLHSDQEFEGTGIGLALVRRIINRHNGEIWIEAEVNKGATIYFSLP